MKKLLPFLAICILIASCNNSKSSNTTEAIDPINKDKMMNKKSLEGAWELVSFYNYEDNKIVDSFQTSEGYRQVKMYTKSKVMWCKNVPSDSSEWFGYGSYEIHGDTLTEVLDYGSKIMTKIIDLKTKFNNELQLGPNSFTQIEIDDEGNRIYSENYRRIE
ncbi:hypothetical protein [Mangrovimonas sp. DI 80]|uniref:hypothetical protein n=1 Tax=Mangrovimonas sp. DI 80 TaxID=1779330 RepID=UPI000978AF20|nr:hypothetical protein [Mangrovimonas sp. DI 80]OMP32817.1 hypothetical protein BKM32_00465 [Mangrovimonas sp. DI 80]